MKNFSALATFSTLLLTLQIIIPTVTSHGDNAAQPAPPAFQSGTSKFESWIAVNMKEYNERRGNFLHGINRAFLDHDLTAAEDGGINVIKVRKDGTGDFRTVTDAIKSIPSGNTRRVVIWVGGGDYFEKITIDRTKNFVTLHGDPENMPRIVYNGTAAEFGTVNSATVAVESNYFVAVNIAFVNSAPIPDGKRLGAQAVAMRISGDKAAFHNCTFIGFQDTLCDDKGNHFFENCYIEGTVDFIFGNGKSLYLNTTINSVAKNMGVITAHARENEDDDSGFTFVYCNITGNGQRTTYLGRAWKQRPRVVFAHTYMGTIIKSEGWSKGMKPEGDRNVYYGEYKCMGPGATSSPRVNLAKILTEEEAKPFMSLTYIHGSNWLLPPPKL